MDMQIRDRFARQRAELANERTLLAYIRTSLGFVFVGVPAIWWLERLYVPRLRVVSLSAEILSRWAYVDLWLSLSVIGIPITSYGIWDRQASKLMAHS